MQIKNKMLYFFICLLLSNLCNAKNLKFHMTFQNDFMSVCCQSVLLEDFMAEFSKQTKIGYKIYSDMKKRKVSANFENLQIEPALKHLLGENYAIIYNRQHTKNIEKIYILNKGKHNQQFDQIQSFYQNTFPKKEILNQIVHDYVIKEHPDAQLYHILPHYHLNGQLNSYIYTYYLGSGNPPELQSLETQIMQAFQKKQQAIKIIQKANPKQDVSIISQAVLQSRKLSEQISQEKNYISLEIAASYDFPPVMAFWHGLPLDISQKPKAFDIATKKIGKPLKYMQTYTTGIMSVVFAYEDQHQNKVYVNPAKKKVFSQWTQTKKPDPDVATKNRNKNKWLQFLNL